jgi:peptidoglycan hydrolase CwlO-like protein
MIIVMTTTQSNMKFIEISIDYFCNLAVKMFLMLKIPLVLLILFLSTAVYSNVSNNKCDTLFVLNNEYLELNNQILTLKCEINEINENANRINGRIDDWYTNLAIGSGIFLVLLGGLIGFQWSNAKGVAKKEAEKELKSVKEKIKTAEKDLQELKEKHSAVLTMYELIEEDFKKLKEGL